MKELLPVTQLGCIIDATLIQSIHALLESNRLMMVKRCYFFTAEYGYSLEQACNYIDGLAPLIQAIEGHLNVSELVNTKIVERGIAARLTSDIVSPRALNSRNFDYVARHVRVPVSGMATLADERIIPGYAYILDNMSGHKFTATKDAVHLVFSYVSNTDTRKIWDLWRKPHEG